MKRWYLIVLQAILLSLYSFSLHPPSTGHASMGVVLMLALLAGILAIPQALLGTPWFVALVTLGDMALLMGTVAPERRDDVGMVCAIVLLIAMASYLDSVIHFGATTVLLLSQYGLSLHHGKLLETEMVFALAALLGVTLVFVSKNGIVQAELERMTARQNQTQTASLMDSLTGLPHRAQFLRALTRVVEYGRHNRNFQYAVLFIDLDGFKPINDRFGHKAGDAVLQHVAKVLQRCLRKGDLASRYGGDEFTLLVTNVRETAEVIQLAERVLQRIRMPVNVGEPVQVGASIGIALSTNLHERAEDLIADADSAMYRAKAQGKNRYVLSDQRTNLPKSELLERWRRLVPSKW